MPVHEPAKVRVCVRPPTQVKLCSTGKSDLLWISGPRRHFRTSRFVAGVRAPHFEADVVPVYHATLARVLPLAAREGLVEWFGVREARWDATRGPRFQQPEPTPRLLAGGGLESGVSRPVR